MTRYKTIRVEATVGATCSVGRNALIRAQDAISLNNCFADDVFSSSVDPHINEGLLACFVKSVVETHSYATGLGQNVIDNIFFRYDKKPYHSGIFLHRIR